MDSSYYPYILKFKTEEQARKEYEYLKQRLIKDKDVDDAIFLAEVKEHFCGTDYEIEYEE